MKTLRFVVIMILCCGISLAWSLSGCGSSGDVTNSEDVACTDVDQDGFFAEDACGTLVDCDDFDEDVNPGTTEGPEGDATCSDGIDNDCDGLADAAVADGCEGLVPVLTVDSLNPLGIARYEGDPVLSEFTLVTNGYDRLAGNKPSEIILLHNDTQRALWVYAGDEIGGLNFSHNVDLLDDEMIISDTSNDRVLIVEAKGGVYSEDPDFHLVWTSDDDAVFNLDYPNDANFLSNGNLLITDRNRHRVIEVNRDTGRIVWQFGVTDQSGSDDTHLNGPHNADRLSNGNTIVADSNNNRILEVDSMGGIVWEYAPTGGERLNWPRDADVLANGHVLITDSRNGRVIEVNEEGDTVWEFRISIIGTMSEPYEADQLNNENVLISCPGLGSGAIYEVDYFTKEVVWGFSP